MAQTITINLPDKLYQQLRKLAELSSQSPETIVEQSLAFSLPPLLEDILPEYQADVFPLLQMSVSDLEKEVTRVLPSQQWADYQYLLDKKKGAALSPEEQLRLTSLRREADVLTFRKAYAAVLLKRQGFKVPSSDDLPQPE